jgi:hypothetical protein
VVGAEAGLVRDTVAGSTAIHKWMACWNLVIDFSPRHAIMEQSTGRVDFAISADLFSEPCVPFDVVTATDSTMI